MITRKSVALAIMVGAQALASIEAFIALNGASLSSRLAYRRHGVSGFPIYSSPSQDLKMLSDENDSNDVFNLDDEDEDDLYQEESSTGKNMLEEALKEARDIGELIVNAVTKEERSLQEKFFSPKETANTAKKYYEITSPKEDQIKYVPTKEMTGVTYEVTRMCASVSGQVYFAKSKNDFDFGQDKNKEIEIIFFDDNQKLNPTTPAFVIAVTGSTMIMGWTGTTNPMDMFVDVAFAPHASRAWTHTARNIRAQGSMLAVVENHMCLHEEMICNEITKRGIEEIIFTGHSLGGGIAQVAHLFVQGEMMIEHSPWNQMENLKIRTIAFAAPMSICLLDRKDKESLRFIKRAGEMMCNIIYRSDVVPRGYGNLQFTNALFKDIIPQIIKEKMTGFLGIIRIIGGVDKRASNLFQGMIRGNEETIAVMTYFRHIGRIIYYGSKDSKPEIYIDNGYYYKPQKKKKTKLNSTKVAGKLFRDLKYKKMKDPIETLERYHMFLVGIGDGPGLAYNRYEEKP